jgi:hypothetical protein
MKLKFSISFLFALTCMATSQAQINKGSVLLGTSIGYSQTKSENLASAGTHFKIQTFKVSPSVGVALKENLVAGIRFNYLNSIQKSTFDPSTHKQDNKNYGGSLFIRRYVPLVSRLFVFGEGSASYNVIREKYTEHYYSLINDRKGKGWNTGLHITPGIAYGVCKKFQVECGFNSLLGVTYEKNKTTFNNYNTEERKSFTGGIGQDSQSMFFIGFQFVL